IQNQRETFYERSGLRYCSLSSASCMISCVETASFRRNDAGHWFLKIAEGKGRHSHLVEIVNCRVKLPTAIGYPSIVHCRPKRSRLFTQNELPVQMKTLARLALLVVLILATPAPAARAWPFQSKVTRENYEKGHNAMTKAQVEEILRSPTK